MRGKAGFYRNAVRDSTFGAKCVNCEALTETDYRSHWYVYNDKMPNVSLPTKNWIAPTRKTFHCTR